MPKASGALRLVSLSRGHDPRDFALFAFGGAGPLHASALARELAVPKVLVPARPGITNALGCLAADVRHDYVNTVNQPVADLDMAQVKAIYEAQIEEGRATIEREGVEVTDITVLHSADMQFLGQSHILTIPVSGTDAPREEFQTSFEEAYWRRFEVELSEIRAVLVNLHTAVIGKRRGVPLDALAHANGADREPAAQRRVWFESGWAETPIYRREQLPAGATLTGPAVIEQLDTTIVVEPGDAVEADGLGNLIISVDGGRS
jgi:N-methylhydantoinase A